MAPRNPRSILATCTFVVLAAVPGVASAQADSTRADTTVFRIEGIQIQSQRPVTTIGGASAVEVDIENLPMLPAAPTGAEVLKEVAGVHVRTNSRGQAEISVRGSESRQVAVLLDGVPLTLGYDARTDLSILPATALEDVSFVRGMSSLLHGPNVLGGVVEMGIARASSLPTERSMQFTAGVDHVGGYSTSATTTLPFETDGGQGMVRGGVGFRDSPGMPLADGVSEPVPSDDLRLNTDFHNVDGFVAARYVADGGAWSGFSATSHRADRGIAAELGATDPRLWRYPEIRRTILALSGGTGQRGTPLGRGDLEASVGYDTGVTDIRSYTTRAYDVIDGSEDGDDRTITLRLLGDHTLGSRGDLRTSFTWANIRHEESVDATFREFEQHLMSTAAETVWRLVDRSGDGLSSVRLTLGGAWDRGTTPVTGGLPSLPTIDDWGARAGLSALFNEGNTMVHASASRRGRFPSLRESYSEALNRFEPNPDLKPEHLFSTEAGVTTRLGSGEIQVVGFRQKLTDAIRRVSLPNGRRQRINSEELASHGVEVFLSQTLGRVDVGGELTLQSVELTDPGTQVNTNPENVPERFGSAYVRVPIMSGLFTTFEAEYTGSQFCIDPNSGQDVELDGGSWFNALVSKMWSLGGRRLETTASALNLSNTALYDACGLPRAGRLFRFQMRVF
jgi:iron complex outermembrane receptor protein